VFAWALPLLLSPAMAGECAERITAEAFRTRVEAVREPVAFADPSAQKQLDSLLSLLNGCINGPIRREDIAAVFLARGALEILSGADSEWHIKLARDHLTWAYAVGSRDAWEPMYGPQVEEVFDEVSGQLLEKGVLDLTFRSAPEVMVVDGDVVRDTGRRFVTAGAHVVQWKDGTGWHGEFVRLAPEETKSVGGGRSTRDTSLLGGGKEKKKAYRIKWGPQPTGHVNALGRLGADLNRVGHELGAYRGGHLFPSARAEGHLFVYRALSVRMAAGLGPGAKGDRPPSGQEALFGLGYGQQTDSLLWDFNVGGAWKAVAAPVTRKEGENVPTFHGVGVPTALVSGHVAIDQIKVDVHASVASLGGSGFKKRGLGLEAKGRYVLGEETWSPVVGVHAGGFMRDGTADRADVYRWIVFEGGMQWSY